VEGSAGRELMPETVSVLIASYNCARFLPECLKSVLAQTRPPEEIIVVDDGSEDRTPDVMRSFPDVRYIRQEHGGKSAAFNRAVAEARGDILCHLDADDYWMAPKLERVCKELTDNPALGGAIHEVRHVDEDGNRFELGYSTKFVARPAVIRLDDCEDVGFLYPVPAAKGFFAGNPNTTVTRRSALVDLFPLWPDMGLGVDCIFVAGALRSGLLYLPELLSAYRHHRSNAWLGNPYAYQHVIDMWRFLLSQENYRSRLSPRHISLLEARILEIEAYQASRTGRNKVRGLIAGIQVPMILLRNGLLFNWRHLALPIACVLPVRRTGSSASQEHAGFPSQQESVVTLASRGDS
jgi:glycosyltransferase involved in cell wall biosynthesis